MNLNSPEVWIAAVMLAALVLYALSGGADFGGGVWDLLATGPRAAAQRRTIASAIAPIWEANHVWLILVIVLLFSAFPKAFALISITLHIPLTLILIGIVMRGSAFVFRSKATSSDPSGFRWSLMFSIASIVTPVFLGTVVGSVAGGKLPAEIAGKSFAEVYVAPWLAPFPIVIGFFTLALFSYLAAVYLIFETRDPDLKDDFRRRAIAAGACAALLALISSFLLERDVPQIWEGMQERDWLFQIGTALVSGGAICALVWRKFQTARVLVVLQIGLILIGWAFAQLPYVVPPHLTVSQAAAPPSVLLPLLGVIAVGAVLLFPSFIYLFYVFKIEQIRVKK